jgi:hypothetical protein
MAWINIRERFRCRHNNGIKYSKNKIDNEIDLIGRGKFEWQEKKLPPPGVEIDPP